MSDDAFLKEWKDYLNDPSYKIIWRGKEWKTPRHAYEAAKFFPHVSTLVEKINQARTVREVEEIADAFEHHTRLDWQEVCISVREEILSAMSGNSRDIDIHVPQNQQGNKDVIFKDIIMNVWRKLWRRIFRRET